jgi:purine-binding chemotaxis protein CheW
VSLPFDSTTSFLRVRLGDATIGLPTAAVREIVRAVAITHLPAAPSIIEGAVNVRGELVPVVDVRRRLALSPKALHPDECLVIVRLGTRVFAMRVDDVDDLIDVDTSAIAASGSLSPALEGLATLTARPDGLLVMYDPAAFLTHAELDALDRAIAAAA